jgi:uncharacterized protein YciI
MPFEIKFVILGFDGPEGQAKRKIHRPAHIERLERWNSKAGSYLPAYC